jgi:hypothetical protein
MDRLKRRQSASSDHIATANRPPMLYLGVHQRPTTRLALPETLQLLLQGKRFYVDRIDHLVANTDPLPGGRAELQPLIGQRLASLD